MNQVASHPRMFARRRRRRESRWRQPEDIARSSGQVKGIGLNIPRDQAKASVLLLVSSGWTSMSLWAKENFALAVILTPDWLSRKFPRRHSVN